MTAHTGEKPYACKKCGKKYSSEWSRNSHAKKCLGEQGEGDDEGSEEDGAGASSEQGYVMLFTLVILWANICQECFIFHIHSYINV